MIGIFDSGIGGLTVVRELLRQRPDASFIYLGDAARVPYGNKAPETIIRYALEDAAFLMDRGVTSLVMACNTMSAYACDAIREAYPKLPFFDVITPAVEAARAVTCGRIGVIGTRATIASGAYDRAIRERLSDLKIVSTACPLFVPLVEEGWLNDAETKRIVRRYLSPLREAKIDTLILGCTHYPLLAPLIQRTMGRRVRLVDSGASVVSRVRTSMPTDFGHGDQTYYLTDLSARSDEIARSWLGKPIRFERAVLA